MSPFHSSKNRKAFFAKMNKYPSDNGDLAIIKTPLQRVSLFRAFDGSEDTSHRVTKNAVRMEPYVGQRITLIKVKKK